MSLYNLLFGQNETAPALLALLNQVANLDPPRYRDCYFDGEYIVVHTRTGGGNREDYELENAAMTEHPWYVDDADDDFDCTYADFRFRPPPEIAATLSKAEVTPAERWQLLLNALKAD